MYLDTCIEPWPGGYTDPTVPAARRTNYALREEALALRPGNARAPTAVLTHGANPGWCRISSSRRCSTSPPTRGVEAGKPAIARRVGRARAPARRQGDPHRRARHAGHRSVPKQPGEFVNTWSIDGFVSEGSQPSEMGWGTHERNFPRDGKRHDFGCMAAIYLMQPGAATRVRTWTPRAGHFHGFCITHGEAISMADYYTVRDGAQVVYRPTVHYAYHPCDSAVVSVHELAGRNYVQQERQRILMDDIDGRHRRARRAARRAQEERLLVRLAALDRRGAQARALQQRDQPAGDRRRCWRAWSGRWRIRTAASSSPTRWTSGATWRSACPTSGPVVGAVHRLDAAARARAAFPGGHRQERSLAVQERPGDLVGLAALVPYSIATITNCARRRAARPSTSSSRPCAAAPGPAANPC